MERFRKGLMAKEFFMKFYNADCGKICIENPVPMKIFGLPPVSQFIQPYQFGHPYIKKTGLWLKGLPLLVPTEIVTDNIVPFISAGSKDRHGNDRKRSGIYRDSKVRSKTFEGIARAMAEQWG